MLRLKSCISSLRNASASSDKQLMPLLQLLITMDATCHANLPTLPTALDALDAHVIFQYSSNFSSFFLAEIRVLCHSSNRIISLRLIRGHSNAYL